MRTDFDTSFVINYVSDTLLSDGTSSDDVAGIKLRHYVGLEIDEKGVQHGLSNMLSRTLGSDELGITLQKLIEFAQVYYLTGITPEIQNQELINAYIDTDKTDAPEAYWYLLELYCGRTAEDKEIIDAVTELLSTDELTFLDIICADELLRSYELQWPQQCRENVLSFAVSLADENQDYPFYGTGSMTLYSTYYALRIFESLGLINFQK